MDWICNPRSCEMSCLMCEHDVFDRTACGTVLCAQREADRSVWGRLVALASFVLCRKPTSLHVDTPYCLCNTEQSPPLEEPGSLRVYL